MKMKPTEKVSAWIAIGFAALWLFGAPLWLFALVFVLGVSYYKIASRLEEVEKQVEAQKHKEWVAEVKHRNRFDD